MISIVIASVKSDLLIDIKKNIEKTIGTDFEILSFENSGGKKSLCEIYNIAAKEAKYNLICYMHEDIEIKTEDWGKKVIDLFSMNPNIGIAGVAGSSYKSFAPSSWGSESSEEHLIFRNYLQQFKHSNKPPIHVYSNPNNSSFEKVVTVDGMWFCTTKEVVGKTGFDEDMLKGFHCYDLDFCLNVGRFYDVVVTFDILLEHFSEGGYNRDWLYDTLKLHKKWENSLPRSVAKISEKHKDLIEKRAYKRILSKLVELKFDEEYILRFLKEYKKKSNMEIGSYLKLRYYYIKFKYLGKKIE